MRPLARIQLGAFAVVSALLVSCAAVETTAGSALAAPEAAEASAQTAPAPPLPRGTLATGLTWLGQPAAIDYARLYPDRAQQDRVSGRVTIECLVDDDGWLECIVVTEEPPGYGFGEATLRLSRFFRVAPQTANGTPTAGGRVRQTIRWVIS